MDMPGPSRIEHVVVRTHGGLGNQLFQILYASLFAGNRTLEVIHDTNYPHRFELSTGLAGFPQPGLCARMISAARIPKLLERSRLSTSGSVRLIRAAYLDGYFQTPAHYEKFHARRIRQVIQSFRSAFSVDPGDVCGDELHHIRLGDFFSSVAAEREHLTERLEKLPDNAFIMTNREDLVREVIGSARVRTSGLSIVPSAAASPEDTLRLMSRYRVIVSNDSTLAFWAACLAERRLVVPSARLNALFAQFTTSHT
jgi:hypothetical protein